jgi:NAD(P)-dependent dehydrogenase (short-subunit alcohol dehydrogenase family)
MFDAINSVNVRGSFLVGREAARQWRLTDSPGQLIFTSSWVQGVSWPETAPYSASKAAVQSLARSFARELAPFGIRSNVVAPGIVRVGMAKRQWDSDPAYRARAERAVPMGYLQTPESVADAFLFMCSSLSRYMTGATLVVDGGCSLYPMS